MGLLTKRLVPHTANREARCTGGVVVDDAGHVVLHPTKLGGRGGPPHPVAVDVEEVAAEVGEAVSIYKVNVDENTELAQEHGVQSIPTLLVFKGGNLLETVVGLKTKDELVSIVQD